MRLLILDPETARGASWLLFKGRSLGVTHSSNLGSLILRSVVGIHRSLPTGSRVRNKNPTHRRPVYAEAQGPSILDLHVLPCRAVTKLKFPSQKGCETTIRKPFYNVKFF